MPLRTQITRMSAFVGETALLPVLFECVQVGSVLDLGSFPSEVMELQGSVCFRLRQSRVECLSAMRVQF